MEPRKIETPVKSRREGTPTLPGLPERKRRFQMIKLEERIAPGSRNTHGTRCTITSCAVVC
jgi:hypothetical protein